MSDMKTTELRDRLLDGLERLASVMRADVRRKAASQGINAAQNAILRLLLARPAGLRVRAIADHLGVRQPTVSDSLVAMEHKGRVERRRDPSDARAAIITAAPSARTQPTAPASSHATAVLAELSGPEQASLLKTLIKIIRGLQLRQAIPPQRMCVTCEYFRPFAHPGGEAPHHCAFVDAPFGDRALRLDCAEHEEASSSLAARNWSAFTLSRPHDEARP